MGRAKHWLIQEILKDQIILLELVLLEIKLGRAVCILTCSYLG